MCSLDFYANLASIAGFIITLITLYRVITLKGELFKYTTFRKLEKMIDEILSIPEGKTKLTDSQKREVEQILQYLEQYYLNWIPFIHKIERNLINNIRKEIEGKRNTKNIKNDLELIQNKIKIMR